jgi:hypothetical protein
MADDRHWHDEPSSSTQTTDDAMRVGGGEWQDQRAGSRYTMPEAHRLSRTADCEARALARLPGELGRALLHVAHGRL